MLDFHPHDSPSRAAEDSLTGEGFQVSRDSGCPRLQLASSSLAPRPRLRVQKELPDQPTLKTSRGVAFFVRVVPVY